MFMREAGPSHMSQSSGMVPQQDPQVYSITILAGSLISVLIISETVGLSRENVVGLKHVFYCPLQVLLERLFTLINI